MRKMAKAAVALVMGCVLLSTSAFAMTDNINGSAYLDEGVYEVVITELGEGESTIIVLPEGVALEDANEGNILYINQKTIVDGAATYAINLGADFKQAATVYAGGTGMSATTLGTLKAYIPVESVTLAAAEGKTVLEIGETVDITAAIAPATASEQAITWSENVAVNGTTATFTATEAGTFTVTATATADNVIGTIEITVNPAAPENIPVTGLALEVADAELEIGETTTITATVTPDDATDKTVKWSDNVTVAADGVTATFEAKTAGIYTITATAGDVSKTVTITVKEKEPEIIPVTGLALEVVDDELEIGETTTITATVTPDDATDKTITWSGNVTPDGATATFEATEVGTYTITATAGDISKTVTITVVEPAPEYILGDIVGSVAGVINIDDVVAAQQISLNLGEWSDLQRMAADVVGSVDGVVNIDDVVAVQQRSLNLSVEFK